MAKLLLHIALFFGLLLAPVLGWTDFQAGIDAYYHGDYLIAQKEIRPLAEQGHSGAQLLLGLMYWSGRGVADDYVLAHMWLSLAASQGEETAWVYLVKLAKSMTPYQYNTPQILDHRIR